MSAEIDAAVANTQTSLPDHYATLLGEREAGSSWGRDFTEADFSLPWVDDTENVHADVKMEGCQYFKIADVHVHFPDARVSAMRLNNLHPDLVKEIITQEGAHGAELAIKLSAFATVADTQDEVDAAWLIVGDHEEERIVFTAHPGPLLKPLPQGEGELNVQDMYDDGLPIAVKVV